MTSKKIQKLNDKFRKTGEGGKLFFSEGISSLCITLRFEILTEVRSFDKFTEDNDPYGEHDLGSFEYPEVGKIFWKIDYYDLNLEYHSEDASDPFKTIRALTIMFADEY